MKGCQKSVLHICWGFWQLFDSLQRFLPSSSAQRRITLLDKKKKICWLKEQCWLLSLSLETLRLLFWVAFDLLIERRTLHLYWCICNTIHCWGVNCKGLQRPDDFILKCSQSVLLILQETNTHATKRTHIQPKQGQVASQIFSVNWWQ